MPLPVKIYRGYIRLKRKKRAVYRQPTKFKRKVGACQNCRSLVDSIHHRVMCLRQETG